MLLAAATLVSGCGDSGNAVSAAESGTTSPTPATGATGRADKPKEDSSGAADGAPAPKMNGTPKSVQADVGAAFARLMAAYRNRDYDYVCNKAYSSDYVAELAKRGGCKTVVAQENVSVASVSGEVKGMHKVSDDLVEVNVVLTIKPKTGSKVTNKTEVHFKEQNGDWKYFIYTGKNG